MGELVWTPCDKCGHRAYVRVTLDTGGELDFCGHHARQYEDALLPYVIAASDQRHLLDA